ncbi:16S rRNA (guanine(527)-N(7))-methyltransferase RsmG [Rhodobaculum claviforme]|uniref:16S rRNA (guanine(527)-N(7))-methyltransferase RsmG n=1 Tax=Rhodobaculum claviforme TaxID=1549854 RepID=UPI001F5C0EC7|nr:16S rRNA (guanine(527)-N(7))-methyltransferase RsmG [Rhodobaculum claviforme]
MNRLNTFVELLRTWNSKINLVSPATLNDVWTRHIDDSLQLVDFAPGTASRWVDLGSGAGFPGLVVAIAAAESRPSLKITLIESDQRKAAFLVTAARACGVDVAVVADRVESTRPQNADVVSARALAPLTRLLGLAERHLAASGVALFLKGGQSEAEIATALEHWRFQVHKHPSKTSAEGVVLAVEDISRV